MYYSPWSMVHHGRVQLDFSKCRYLRDVHNALKTAFDFPDYYGANWNAFEDCLEDFCISWNQRITVSIEGFEKMPRDVREACAVMQDILSCAQSQYPYFHYCVLS